MLSFFKMTNWQTELTTIRKTLHNKGKTGENDLLLLLFKANFTSYEIGSDRNKGIRGSLYENGHYDGRHHYVFSIHFHSWLRRQAW